MMMIMDLKIQGKICLIDLGLCHFAICSFSVSGLSFFVSFFVY